MPKVVSDDVDIPTMLIFLQFYEFVNFRLYHSINLEYPPRLDTRLEAFAADLYALSRYANVTKPSGLIFEASQLDDSKQVEYKRKGTDGTIGVIAFCYSCIWWYCFLGRKGGAFR
ncbi:hypothetical protein MtrunA17_Chr6g0458851 [Medicago truncatula]|uniref:Pescadillo amino-terminal protein n=1 Tax=Medicago truncatula TaxID=3880 RepID=A0A072UI07_MEDTR|nr:pescadillo amino-terminal protein [Medicago truncatula]RHN50567.1 hypothetical protein MtrunA17_Chr6g0458851 [Medicago truncatula]